MTESEQSVSPRAAAPIARDGTGHRWATGGGSNVGGCNGLHLAAGAKAGTLCGLYGPYTPPDPPYGKTICGNCARIAGVDPVTGTPS